MLFGSIRGCKGKVSLFDLLDEWMNFLLIRWRLLGQRSPEQGLELWWRQDFRSISVFDKCLRNCSSRNEGHTLGGKCNKARHVRISLNLVGEIQIGIRTRWLLTCHVSNCERELWKWVFPKIMVPIGFSILGFSIINHPFWGPTPNFWKHPNGDFSDKFGEMVVDVMTKSEVRICHRILHKAEG